MGAFRSYLREQEAIANKTLYLMRHGRTALDTTHRSDGWLDFPLSDDGRIGLIEAQQLLKSVPLTQIWAAPLKRTSETARIIGSGVLNAPILKLAPQIMTWHLGMFMGTKKKASKPIVKHFIDNPTDVPPGGESLKTFRDRFLPWMKDREDDVLDGKGPILVVLSGSNLREMSKEITGDCETLNLDEGGLVALKNIEGKWEPTVLLGSKDNETGLVS